MFRIRKSISLILIIAVTLLTANFIYTPTLLASFFEETAEDGFQTLGANAGSQYANENEDFSVFLGSPQNPTTLSFSRNGSSITINLENVSYQIEEEEIPEEEPEEELLEELPEEEVIETEEQIDEEESTEEPFDETPSSVETTEDTQGEESPPEEEEPQPSEEINLPELPPVQDIIDEVVDTIEDILGIGEPPLDESPEGEEPSEDQAQPEPSDEASILPEPETEELLPDLPAEEPTQSPSEEDIEAGPPDSESVGGEPQSIIEDVTETIQDTIEEVQETVEQAIEEVTEVAEEITAFFLSIPRAIAGFSAKALAKAGDFFQNLIHTAFALPRVALREVWAIFEPGKESVTIQEVYAGVDFTYTISQDGVKEQIILKMPGAPNEFTFKLDTQGVTKIKKLNKRIYFFNDQGESLFYIPAPFMVDAQGNRSEDISLSLRDQNGNDVLTASNANLILTPSSQWLSSPDRVYPITIDPSISIDHSLKERQDMFSFSTQQFEHRDKDGNPTGTFILEAFVGPIQYQEAEGAWEEIDLNFHPDGQDYVMDRHVLEVRVSEEGVAVTEQSNGKGIRWHTPERPAVSGRRASFEDQGLHWAYHTRKSGIKLVADVASRQGPRTYVFRYELLGEAAPLVPQPDGSLISDAFTVPSPLVYGANGETYPAGGWRLLDEGRISFDFDDSTLSPEAFPYELDPTTTFSVTASGDDGHVEHRKLNVYPPDPPDGTEIDTTWESMTVRKTRVWLDPNYQFYITVGLIRWDTSSLPDNAIVTAATLRAFVWTKANMNSRSLTADWYTAWPIDDADYTSTVGTNAHAGTTIASITSGADNDFALDNVAANVSLTGYTGLRLHISGGEPSGENYVLIRPFDHATAPEPRLIVTYTANAAPTAPTTLFVGETDAQTGTANPTNVGDRTPMFSAICNDPDAGDIMNKYRIQVDNNSDFLSAEWDSGAAGTAMANCTAGNRSANIEFGGTALLFDGQTFYWRIKFWDDDNAEGAFSGGTDTFQMLGPGKQMRHGKYFFNATTKRIFSW